MKKRCLGMRRGFWGVQVKCATPRPNGKYNASGCSHKFKYTKNETDFLAAWVIRENIWYIVPVEAFEGRDRLHFYPGAKLKRGENKLERIARRGACWRVRRRRGDGRIFRSCAGAGNCRCGARRVRAVGNRLAISRQLSVVICQSRSAGSLFVRVLKTDD